MPNNLTTDTAIVGGGIAGLWLNARLRQQGHAWPCGRGKRR